MSWARIVIITAGTRGDVQPYVALGEALKEAGFAVRMITHPDFRAMVEAAGLDFHSIGIGIRERVRGPEGATFVRKADRPFHLIQGIMRAFLQHVDEVMDRLVAGCEDADILVFSGLGFPAFHIAEARNMPAVAAYLQPLTPTSAFPAPIGSFPSWLRTPWTNRATYILAQLFSWWMVRKPSNGLRQRLGLQSLGLRGPFPHIRQGVLPHLYAFSAHVVPCPPDWPEWAHITGYWFCKTPAFTAPAELAQFLENHHPVIYIGFGSLHLPHPDEVLSEIFQALERLDVFAVMSRGWGEWEVVSHPRVFWVEEIPHEWLFPRVEAVVHHGGAGTTAMGLRFGRPTVIMPFLADQFFWGERVEALGVGRMLPRARNLKAARLYRVLKDVLSSEEMREKAEALGVLIREERGLEQAVEKIQTLLDEARRNR